MTGTATLTRADIQHLLATEGQDLFLEVADTAATYDPATALMTKNNAEQVPVRGVLYSKRTLRRTGGAGEQSEVWLPTQRAIIEARLITFAPKQGDYLHAGETQWAITAIETFAAPDGTVLFYQLTLGQA